MKKILTAHKIAKIKGAKISLWTNSPKLRAAKIKGFTVPCTENYFLLPTLSLQ